MSLWSRLAIRENALKQLDAIEASCYPNLKERPQRQIRDRLMKEKNISLSAVGTDAAEEEAQKDYSASWRQLKSRTGA